MTASAARRSAAAAGVVLLASLAGNTYAVALTAAEVAAACAGADGLAHCGRLIEDIQSKRLPALAVREGDTLHLTLYPSGRTSFADTPAPNGGRSYSLWDYLDSVNIAVLYVVQGDDASFALLQRTSGRTYEVPAEPRLAPDRQRLVTADFCESRCTNEVTLFRVSRDAVRKEASWKPAEAWIDATVRWKSADILEIEYTRSGDATTRTLERRLDATGWTRVAQP
ncbi:MAG: hypothetical protein ABJC33_02640 [Betaproteobacteria bacterium]